MERRSSLEGDAFTDGEADRTSPVAERDGDADDAVDEASDAVVVEEVAPTQVETPVEVVDAGEDGLGDPWNLVRIAMGSLAGESWRLRQALVWPTEAFKLRSLQSKPGMPPPTLWDSFQKTQTYDNFKRALPFRPNSTNNTIEFVVVGDQKKLDDCLHIDALLLHLEAFIGFPVHLRASPLSLGPKAHPRQATDGKEQFGAHYILAELRSTADPRSVCTIGLTTVDLYPPSTYEFVTGITDASQRVAIYSVARYFWQGSKKAEVTRRDSSMEMDADVAEKREAMPTGEWRKELMTQCLIKTLCREVLKLCHMEECHLVECLLNPFPGGPPEAIKKLPLSLCCICLRKLQWLTQADLLDRYAGLPAVLGDRFMEETVWIWQRMVQVGMPTYASLRCKNPLGAGVA